jgi:organic hydroperoxide reductase OsmC/OhrA
MQDLPHHYSVSAAAEAESVVQLTSTGLPALQSAAPAEFGGPGDKWSPETLLVAAVTDCFILTFKAIARASKFSWVSLTCDVTGTLDKVDRLTQFTEFEVNASLLIPADMNEEKAMRLLEKAEQACLITNSLTATTELTASVQVKLEEVTL